MRRLIAIASLVFAVPALTLAHVGVRPQQSKPGAEERYTVRVPTEGAVATTHIQLEVPDGVTVWEVLVAEGATFETQKQGERIVSITWRKEIAPKTSAEFVFRARNPASGDIVWKAHQHYSDGTASHWVGGATERNRAPVTRLVDALARLFPSSPDQAIVLRGR